MDQDCLVHSLGGSDRLYQVLDIVAVHRTQISNAHVLKKHPGYHQRLQRLFRLADAFCHNGKRVIEGIIDLIAQLNISVRCADIAEIFGHAAHIPGDRHAVVIEDNDQV